MRLASVFLAAMLAGAPAEASAPIFRIGVVCDGAMPIGIQIVAVAPGATEVTIDELMAFCAAQVPAQRPQSWRRTT